MSVDAGRNREVWAAVNAAFTDGDAAARWGETEVTWGLFRIPESRLRVLGDLDGIDVVELGAGTAFLAAAMACAGAAPVAVDLSRAQLQTARRHQLERGIDFPLVEADATHVPLRDAAFDLVVSEYGAAPWCEPHAWLAEAARLLRPGGRLVFLTNSPLAGMCVPAEGGVAGTTLLRAQPDLARVEWPDAGVEHHPSHGDWVAALTGAGFVVDALHELYAPADAPAPDFYDIVTPEWASQWPAEDLWVAHVGR